MALLFGEVDKLIDGQLTYTAHIKKTRHILSRSDGIAGSFKGGPRFFRLFNISHRSALLVGPRKHGERQ